MAGLGDHVDRFWQPAVVTGLKRFELLQGDEQTGGQVLKGKRLGLSLLP
jgi:hypothetical protein